MPLHPLLQGHEKVIEGNEELEAFMAANMVDYEYLLDKYMFVPNPIKTMLLERMKDCNEFFIVLFPTPDTIEPSYVDTLREALWTMYTKACDGELNVALLFIRDAATWLNQKSHALPLPQSDPEWLHKRTKEVYKVLHELVGNNPLLRGGIFDWELKDVRVIAMKKENEVYVAVDVRRIDCEFSTYLNRVSSSPTV